MILASHVILSCYGFWLPNEERDSWSEFVRSWELFKKFGPATKLTTHRSVAKMPYDRARRAAARASLKYPPVRLNGLQARAIASGFAIQCAKSGYTVYACAIMHNHAHLVVARHKYDVMQVVNLLKGAASRQLEREGVHPLRAYAREDGSLPSPWASKCWKVFLNDLDDVSAAIEYTNGNPGGEGLRRQEWKFVREFTR